MGELMEIRHDGELADEHDAMTTWLVVAPSTAGSVEASESQLGHCNAFSLRQRVVQLAEFLFPRNQ